MNTFGGFHESAWCMFVHDYILKWRFQISQNVGPVCEYSCTDSVLAKRISRYHFKTSVCISQILTHQGKRSRNTMHALSHRQHPEHKSKNIHSHGSYETRHESLMWKQLSGATESLESPPTNGKRGNIIWCGLLNACNETDDKVVILALKRNQMVVALVLCAVMIESPLSIIIICVRFHMCSILSNSVCAGQVRTDFL